MIKPETPETVEGEAASVLRLFSPVDIGALRLSHRVIHAPTTRLRADPDHSPSAMMVDYYRQR